MAQPRRVNPKPPAPQPEAAAGFVPLPPIDAIDDEEQVADPMPLAQGVMAQFGTQPIAPRPQQTFPGVRFPNGSTMLGANIHPQSDLRLPVAGETVSTTLDGVMEVNDSSGDFLLPPGTTIYQLISSAGIARYLPQGSWIYLVEIGRDLVWVRQSDGPNELGAYLWEIAYDVDAPG